MPISVHTIADRPVTNAPQFGTARSGVHVLTIVKTIQWARGKERVLLILYGCPTHT